LKKGVGVRAALALVPAMRETGVRLESTTLFSGVRVGEHALVRDSVIGWNSRVGGWSWVTGSVLSEDVGVKLGTRGTLLSPNEGEWLEIPCVPAPGPVIDTTGAGDSLLAGLLTGLLRGMSARDAGLLGAATAACCVTGLGATEGLRGYEETARLAGLPR
jgi:hypothetical protein